ncbi:MAG: hypothetical protein ABL961_13200, partial [Vicinamibacterales bacterium]
PQPPPARRLVTKARQQELHEEHAVTAPINTSPVKAARASGAPPAAAPTVKSPSERASQADSPDLLALLTGRKKPAPPTSER